MKTGNIDFFLIKMLENVENKGLSLWVKEGSPSNPDDEKFGQVKHEK